MAVALTLAATGSLAGCGAGDGAAKSGSGASTSTADFCETYNSLFEKFSVGQPPQGHDAVSTVKDWAAQLRSTGTPKGMPADAREGYRLIVTAIERLDDDASQKDVARMTSSFSAAERKSSEAFGNWATDACPLSTPSDAPTSSPE